MVDFGLNRTEIQDGYNAAAMSPYDPARDTPPGFFEGSLDVVPRALETSVAGLTLAATRSPGSLVDRDYPEFNQDLMNIVKANKPDPQVTGWLGNVMFGLGTVIPQVVVGAAAAGPLGAATVVYNAQTEQERAMLEGEIDPKTGKKIDPETALLLGRVAGGTQALGVVVPGAVPGRLATRLLSGSALNVAIGAGQRGVTGKILEEKGYPAMADQYKVVDGAAMMTDAILGAFFGALHRSGRKETDGKLPPDELPPGGGEPPISPENHPLPSEVDAALAANNVHQLEIDSAPGIPTDMETRNSHINAMDKAFDQMTAGKEVNVADTISDTNFLPRPENPEIKNDFEEAAKEHGLKEITDRNQAENEAAVNIIVNRSMRDGGRSAKEADVSAPLFARLISRFSEAFGENPVGYFGRNVLEFRTTDQAGNVQQSGSNVGVLLGDLERVRAGEQIEGGPAMSAAIEDFGKRLEESGITPEQAAQMPHAELLAQVYNDQRPQTGDTILDQLPNLEVSNEPGQLTITAKPAAEPVSPENRQAITDRLQQVAEKRGIEDLGFKSKMQEVVGQKLNESGTPGQIKDQVEAMVKNGAFKQEEYFWSGLDDWLGSMAPDIRLTKADVLEFLKDSSHFDLEEVGESRGDKVNAVPTISQDSFAETSRDYVDPDPSWIKEMAQDNYYDDELKDLTEENNKLPDNARLDEAALEEKALEQAIKIAEESSYDDEYNYRTTYKLEGEGFEDADVTVEEDGGGDYYNIFVNGESIGDVRDWPQVISRVTEHLTSQGFNVGEAEEMPQFSEWTAGGGTNYSFYRLRVPTGLLGGEYRSNHYDNTDVVTHYRTKDRIGPDGEKMLFIEEVQSDLHQEAYKRKKQGKVDYKQPQKLLEEDERAKYQEANRVIKENEDLGFDNANAALSALKNNRDWQTRWQFNKPEDMKILSDWLDSYNKVAENLSAPPVAPFTKIWREIAFKRMLVRAQEGGYKSIGWSTGSAQNYRYNLSHLIKDMMARRMPDDTFIVKSEPRVMSAIRQTLGGTDTGSGFVNITDGQLVTVFGEQGAKSIRAHASRDGFTMVDFAKEVEIETAEGSKTSLYDNVFVNETKKVLRKIGAEEPHQVDYKTTEKADTSRAKDFDKIWYASLSDNALKKIEDGFELFQKERGSITFNRTERNSFADRLHNVVIAFTDRANESTAPHEFSHWGVAVHRLFAEKAREQIAAGRETPEIRRILDDWETLKREVGAKDDVFTPEQEEKVASWFESYMRDGKAPTLKLQEVFDRFRQWLTKIYHDITAAGMEASPAVRDLFDRWLASDEEIKAQRQKDAGVEPQQPEIKDPIMELLAKKPNMKIVLEDGTVIGAQDAMTKIDEKISRAQRESVLYDVAVNCFLRYGVAA